MKFGHDYVYAHPAATTDECIAAIRASFQWVSDADGSRTLTGTVLRDEVNDPRWNAGPG